MSSLLRAFALGIPPIRTLYLESENRLAELNNYRKENRDLRNENADLRNENTELRIEVSNLRQETSLRISSLDKQLLAVQTTLERLDLFCVAGQIIEAPSPPVSAGIRHALEKSGYETVELYLASQIIRPGDTVLDMGSGLGLSAIAAAKAAKGGRIVGYEADSEIAAIARRNIQRNNVEVDLRNKAIAHKAGQIEFFISPEFLANSKFPTENARKISVEAAAFQDVVNEVRPDVITCDIEGVEGEIFADADLSMVRCLVIETHPQFMGSEGVEKCIAELARLGLNLVPHLTWGPIIVCDRDSAASSVQPFVL